MPLLDDAAVAELIAVAHIHSACGECGHHAACDYCRTCDEFYWLHQPGCTMHAPEHNGHRTYLVPYVEAR